MVTIPDSERIKFENLLIGQAQHFGLMPEEYLRKIWYHEEASKLGEYVAMMILDMLLALISPITQKEDN